MKYMRKIFAMVLAVIMVMSLAIGASADTATGSITLNNTVEGTTYNLYKIFDMTQDATDTTKVSYTIAADWQNFFTGDNAGASYLVDANTGSLNQIVVGNTVKYINITEDNVAAFANDAQEYALSTHVDATASVTADETTETVSDLPLGYYLIYAVGQTELKDGYTSLCSLQSTVSNAEVNIKAKAPTIDKTETTPVESADVGTKVEYKITGEVPSTVGYDTYIYTITDTMTNLKYNKDLVLTIGGTTIDYKNTQGFTYTETDTGFTLTIPVKNYTAGAAIVATYSATVTEAAVAAGANNSATLTYSNDPSDCEKTTTTPPDIEKVYSSKIEVTKVDGNDTSKKLDGAKFVLENGEGAYYYWNATDEKVEWYTLTEGETLEQAIAAGKVTEVTTTNGVAEFKGLKDGTYKLVETAAPTGYNKLTEKTEVTINGANSEDKGVTLKSEVKNYSGSTLPSTGGMGTTIFYVAGAILMVGAAVLLVTKRRMNMAE